MARRPTKEIMNIANFYKLSPAERKIHSINICNLARKHVDDGHSIAVCCRKTYIDAKNYSVVLIDAVVRSGYIVEMYNEKNPSSRPVKRIDLNSVWHKDSLERKII